MSIRPSVNIRDLNTQLGYFQACAEEAPEGTYDHVKALAAQLDSAFEELHSHLKAIGLKVNNCDGFREIEALIYGMIKEENPDMMPTFATAEGFGEHVNDPRAREKVLANTIASRDAIISMRAKGLL